MSENLKHTLDHTASQESLERLAKVARIEEISDEEEEEPEEGLESELSMNPRVQRYLVAIEYIGTRFSGSQQQATDRTVVGVLQVSRFLLCHSNVKCLFNFTSSVLYDLPIIREIIRLVFIDNSVPRRRVYWLKFYLGGFKCELKHFSTDYCRRLFISLLASQLRFSAQVER